MYDMQIKGPEKEQDKPSLPTTREDDHITAELPLLQADATELVAKNVTND